MDKRFLILGGGGFIGSHLGDALLARGHTVRLFDRIGIPRYRDFSAGEAMEWVEGDFTSSADIEQAVAGCHLVFHLVSTTLPKSSNDDPIYDVECNVVGTLRLLEAARHAGVEKVVFVSSGGTVYGIPQTVPISENHPTDPVSAYGVGKLAIEKYLRLYHVLHGLDYAILRVANPYGERQRVAASQGAIAVFMDRALRGQTIEIWGDGSVVRDYIYVSDVVEALQRAAFHRGAQRVFNIGSGRGKNLNEILAAIEALLHVPVARRYVSGRVFDVPINVLDIARAKADLGWAPQVGFEDGLSRTLRWLSGGQS